MSLERQAFLDSLAALEDDGVDDVVINSLGYAFAVYEKGLMDTISFLVEALGDITVAIDVEQARETATATLSEVLRET